MTKIPMLIATYAIEMKHPVQAGQNSGKADNSTQPAAWLPNSLQLASA